MSGENAAAALRKRARRLAVECIRELADDKIHTSLWLGEIAGQQSSFVEAVCGLFDDTGFGDDLEIGRPVFNATIDIELVRLARLIRNVNQTAGDAEILRSEAFQQVRQTAATTLAEIATAGFVTEE